MVRMHKLVTIYQEIQDSISYFLKLFRLGREKGVTPEQIIKLVQMDDSIHKLQDKLQQLKSELIDVSRRKAVGQEVLEDFNKEIEAAQEKLDLVNKTFEVKYEELKEAWSRAQKLQNYVEQFIEGQDYQELESVVRNEVEKTLLDNKKLLQNALFSILLALRNDPDRYFMVDKMELTPFTTSIINYDSFLALRRASYPQRSEQLISGRVLELAERIFYNLQKIIV